MNSVKSKKSISIHTLEYGELVNLDIYANERYSANCIKVVPAQEYRILANSSDIWVDLIIKANAKGYYNPLANAVGMRIKNQPCMCLCGVINKNDAAAFPIGLGAAIIISEQGLLHFFANDVKGFEWNNLGKIQIEVQRIK